MNIKRYVCIIVILSSLLVGIYSFIIAIPAEDWNSNLLIAARNPYAKIMSDNNANLEECDYETLKKLLETKKSWFDINATSAMQSPVWVSCIIPWTFEDNALQRTVAIEEYNATKLLLDNGANPNKRGFFSEYPLTMSLGGIYSETKIKIARLLLDNGAKVRKATYFTYLKVQGYSHDLLTAASMHLDSDNFTKDIQSEITALFDLLIKISNEKSPRNRDTGDNTLMVAASVGNVELVDYLLKNKYEDINYQNKKGQTAIFIDFSEFQNDAIPTNTIKVLKYLVQKGIDTSITDKYGMRAYDYAIKYGYKDIAKILEPNDMDTEIDDNTEFFSKGAVEDDLKLFIQQRKLFVLLVIMSILFAAIIAIRKVRGKKIKQQHKLVYALIVVVILAVLANAYWFVIIKGECTIKEKVSWNSSQLSFIYKGEKYEKVTNLLINNTKTEYKCDGYYELVTSKEKDRDYRIAENEKSIVEYRLQHEKFDLIENYSPYSKLLGTYQTEKVYEAQSGCGVTVFHNEKAIYCKKSDIDKVKKYYSDINNYHWYLTYGIIDPRIRIDDYDNAIINQAYLVNRQIESDRDYEREQSITLISNDNILQIEVDLMVFKNGTGYLSLDNGDEVDLNIDFRKYDPYITEY